MDNLTFSQFANILYPFCGCGANQDDFVITLTDKIMQGRPARAIGDDDYKNPMRSKDTRDLQNYFNGARSIPRRDASIILSSIGKHKFKQYLIQQCSDDAMSLLQAEVCKHLKIEVVDDKQDIAEVCADLFTQILQELASGKTTT